MCSHSWNSSLLYFILIPWKTGDRVTYYQFRVQADLMPGWPLGSREKTVTQSENNTAQLWTSETRLHAWQISATSLSSHPCWEPQGNVLMNYQSNWPGVRRSFTGSYLLEADSETTTGLSVAEKHDLCFGTQKEAKFFKSSRRESQQNLGIRLTTGNPLSWEASRQAGVPIPVPHLLAGWPWSSYSL